MTRFEEEQAQARSKVNSGLRFKTNRLSQSKKNPDKQPILNADSYR